MAESRVSEGQVKFTDEQMISDESISNYLNDSGVDFYERNMLNKAFKSFLLSYDITQNTDRLLNLIDVLINNHFFSLAEKLGDIYLSINPTDFEFHEQIKRIESEKSVLKTRIDLNLDGNIAEIYNLPTLIFLHLPKTAGRTLWYILNEQYPTANIHHHIGTPNYIHDFIKLDETKRKSYDVIAGHLYYGIHEYINRNVVYFTILREPVDRTVSNYYYFLQEKKVSLRNYIIENKMGFREFLLTDCHQLDSQDNAQVQLLSGLPLNKGEKVTRQLFELAKKNLRENMAVVGINDQFDKTLMILKRKFGWALDPFYIKQNVTKTRLKTSELDDDIKKIIIEKNQYDIELYNYAKELLAEQAKEYGENLNNDLKEFQYFNKLYQKIIS